MRIMTVALAFVLALGSSAAFAADPVPPPTRPVMYVGNNWSGNITVIDANDYSKVGDINAVPDKNQRLWEIVLNPIRLIAYFVIQQTAGEGHDQLVDDMYSTPDGNNVVISRPSYADVVSIDVRTNAIKWRFPVGGFRADHMAVSPDGTKVALSASTANVVYVLDINTGKELGQFPTGGGPHENIYIDNGTKILNSAIGNVWTPLDAPWLDFLKGDRKITIADANTYQVIKTIDMRGPMDEAGLKDKLSSDAIRPLVLTKDAKTAYMQVSFFNGLLEYNMDTGKVTRVKEFWANPAVNPERASWVNDSRHHGLSISPDDQNLCVAATMDDYAMSVDRATLEPKQRVTAIKPYWATVSLDGKACVISESEGDKVTVIDFATGAKITETPVGDHPQRVRVGTIPSDWTSPRA